MLCGSESRHRSSVFLELVPRRAQTVPIPKPPKPDKRLAHTERIPSGRAHLLSPRPPHAHNVVGARPLSFTSTSSVGKATFCSLPTEIRREIFRYLLPQPSRHNFRVYADYDGYTTSKTPSAGTHRGRRKPSRPLVPDKEDSRCFSEESKLAILRTNRQIYFEALTVLYSENLFHFIGFGYLPVLDFIRRLSPDARELVRRIRLTLYTNHGGERECTGNGAGALVGKSEAMVMNDASKWDEKSKYRNHELFCTVVHDYFPGLTMLYADPWVYY